MCSNTAAPTATRQEFFLFLFLTVVGGLELYRTQGGIRDQSLLSTTEIIFISVF